MDPDQINVFTDSFNFEKMYSDSSVINVFGFGGLKIKRIWIRRGIDIMFLIDGRTPFFPGHLSLLIGKKILVPLWNT